MSPDILRCGDCFINFRLSDITLFIEHKKSNCATVAPEDHIPSAQGSVCHPNDFVSSLLECVKCLRKFPTALPLLMHVQLEHQLLLANRISTDAAVSQQQTFSQSSWAGDGGSLVTTPEPDPVTPPQRLYQFVEEREDTRQEAIPYPLPISATSPAPELMSVGTQTAVSTNKRGSLSCQCAHLPAKRSTLSRISTNNQDTCHSTNTCNPLNVSQSLPVTQCGCNLSHTNFMSPPPNVPKYSTEYSPDRRCQTTADFYYSSIQNGNQQQTPALDCRDTSSPSTCAIQLKVDDIDPVPLSCCDSCCSSVKPVPRTFCCPCPQSNRNPNPETSSTEVQTEDDPEFTGSVDYLDLSALFATPEHTGDMPDSIPNYNIDVEIASAQAAGIDHQQVFNFPPNNGICPIDLGTRPQYGNTILANTTNVATPDNGTNSADFKHSNAIILPSNSDGINKIGTQFVLAPDAMETDPTADKPVDDPKFSCTECGSKFNQKIHLRKHVLTQHIRQKPFHCPLCDYTTVERSHLTVHFRKHTGERPYRCRECHYSSAQNCTLKLHYRRKHPNSQIQCINCSKFFYTDSEYVKHQRMCMSMIK